MCIIVLFLGLLSAHRSNKKYIYLYVPFFVSFILQDFIYLTKGCLLYQCVQ